MAKYGSFKYATQKYGIGGITPAPEKISIETNLLSGLPGSYQTTLDPIPLQEAYDRLNSNIPSINGSRFFR